MPRHKQAVNKKVVSFSLKRSTDVMIDLIANSDNIETRGSIIDTLVRQEFSRLRNKGSIKEDTPTPYWAKFALLDNVEYAKNEFS